MELQMRRKGGLAGTAASSICLTCVSELQNCPVYQRRKNMCIHRSSCQKKAGGVFGELCASSLLMKVGITSQLLHTKPQSSHQPGPMEKIKLDTERKPGSVVMAEEYDWINIRRSLKPARSGTEGDINPSGADQAAGLKGHVQHIMSITAGYRYFEVGS
ncbi:unnamed protein product [Pleuronectes platessa]|uniref:Uncharacterized protein n=1 Tax=Pleuronectes platessa TaxID=8262 RepID=A0A9N7TGU3_PLEPL|nr:unnamed protein product [Pleuronectes platessa]